MKSLWGNLEILTSDIKNPREIIEEQASIFNEMDGNLAYIRVQSKKLTEAGKKNFRLYDDEIEGDFVYTFELRSEYLEEYVYEIFTIYYGIKFYPICIQLSAGIENELDSYLEDIDCIDPNNHRYAVPNERIFVEILKNILSTDELGTIIRNLNLLAKERGTMEETSEVQ